MYISLPIITIGISIAIMIIAIMSWVSIWSSVLWSCD